MADDPVSDGAAFYLSPSLVQAMQRMPDAFPEVAPTSDTTRNSSIPHDNVVDHNDHVPGRRIQSKPATPNSFINASTSEGSQQASGEDSTSLGKNFMNLLENKIHELKRSIELLRLAADNKIHELGEAQKSNTELHQKLLSLKKELAEAHERLKKKDIYTKSLDEYVDELEAKINVLENPRAKPPAEETQIDTHTDSTTTSNPVQQTNAHQNAPVGDAVYRWQAYMIERVEQEVEKLKEDYEDLKEKEEKYFKEAMHFERKHNENVRNMREHMHLCHESKSFLNRDMEENLLKIRAICEERSEFAYGHEAAEESLDTGGDPDSTLVHHESACADAYKRLCSPNAGEADGA